MFDLCLVIPTVIDTSMWVVDGDDDDDECVRGTCDRCDGLLMVVLRA